MLGEDGPMLMAERQISPLVLDLDGDGFAFTGLDGSAVYFDLDADGFAERTGWVEAEDGILARDLNGNGRIDDINEVFGNATTDGFTELAALDADDPGFAELTLWIDSGRDGWTDDGELHALADFDIAAIDLNAALAGHTVNGNTVSHTSTFIRTDGTTGDIVDVWFDNSQIDTLYDGTEPIAWHMLAYGNLRGYGTAPDLVIAMSQDTVLADMVLALTTAPVDELHLAQERAEAIVLRWTGADTADPAGRGRHVDGQHLAALETFSGRPYDQNGRSDPGWDAGALLEERFGTIVHEAATRLTLQGTLSGAFVGVWYDTTADRIRGTLDLDATLAALADLTFQFARPSTLATGPPRRCKIPKKQDKNYLSLVTIYNWELSNTWQ